MDAAGFWSRVRKGTPSECWIWTGATGRGYGRVEFRGRCDGAHRISYELQHGAIPVGLDVLHTCDNPPCVNPAHLYAGTHADNMRDRLRRGRANLPTGDRHYARTRPERLSRGEKHYKAKLTEQDVLKIRRLHSEGSKLSPLARQFGVTRNTVRDICRGTSWSHISAGEAQ